MPAERDVAVAAVPRIVGRDAEIAAAVPRIVGRDAEIARLRGALSAPSALVLIEGEAGIGKSRLVQEALAGADDVMIAICPPLRRGFTLGPVVEAARQGRAPGPPPGLTALAGALRPLFPEWAGDLPAALAALEDAGASQLRLFRALAELLDCLGVAVLVVEDAHWADEATLEFLLFLESRRPRRLRIVLTYRPEEVPADSLVRRISSRSGASRVALPPLDVSRTADLVSSMLDDGPVSEGFACFLHQRTEGVPFAIEESVRLLCERADLVHVQGEWARRTPADFDVPPSVRDSVLERVARLSDAAQLLLRAAAVLAEPSGEADIATVAGLPADAVAGGLVEALGRGLLAEDGYGRLSFGHVLAARAVYDVLPGPQRRQLHTRATAVLESREPRPVVELAYHFRNAGDLAAWRRYAEEAADLALAAGDPVTSADYLRELVKGTDLPHDLARLVRKMPMLATSGHLGRSGIIDALRAALDRVALSDGDRAELRAQLGKSLMHAGEYQAGVAELLRAIPDLGHLPLQAAVSMAILGYPNGTAWPAREHRRWLDAAAAATLPSFPAKERFALQVDRVTGLLDLGDPEGWQAARALPESAATAWERPEVARSALNLGDGAMRWGRYAEARRHLVRGRVLAQESGLMRLCDMIDVTTVQLDWHTGRWEDLDARASDLAALEDETVIRLAAEAVRCMLAAAAGTDPGQTRFRLRAVLAEILARSLAELPHEPAAALARLSLNEGDVTGALAATDEAVELALRKEIWLWAPNVLPARVDALCAAGREAEAERLTGAYAHSVQGNEAPLVSAAVSAANGGLAQSRGDHLEAGKHFAASAAAWQALPRPYFALLARERRGHNLAASPERDAGLAELAAVADELAGLGAAADAARVAQDLRAEGVDLRLPWRRGRRGYGDQLSPRELEVVQLVTAGMTNPQIAQALSRSPKTVAAQLKSAMRKMNVSSRTAVAVAATQAGLSRTEPVGAPAYDAGR